jgi:integrase/recombinase XerD
MGVLEDILKKLNQDVEPRTVEVYPRHKSSCPHAEDKNWKRCNCMKALYIFQGDKDFRLSAKTRAWEKAEQVAREVRESFDPLKRELRALKDQRESKRVLIADAVQKYLSDARSRHLAPATLIKLTRIFQKKMLTWTDEQGLRYLDELTTPQLTDWRASWKVKALTARVMQEIVRSFFRFCIRQDWLTTNPASRLTRIIVKQKPTDYFSREQFQKVLDATYLFGKGSKDGKAEIWSARIRAVLLLMRWSGLRIGDAVTLERSRLVGNKILLYQAKTGTPVYVVLPPDITEALRNVPPSGHKQNPRYFFWNGASRSSAVQTWDKAFRRLFKIADLRNPDNTLKRCYPHMLRDTFAVENLLAGMPIDQVSMLLGHSSVKVTEKHYSPWVAARQQQLETSTLRSLRAQGVLSAEDDASSVAATAGAA